MQQKTIHQSGVVPYEVKSKKVYYVLVTSKSGKWIFPKGILEPNLSPSKSAETEAYEEAGITGQTDDSPFTQYTYDKWGGTCVVDMYLMRIDKVLDEWPEYRNRERRICEYEEARSIIHNRLGDVIECAHNLILKDSK
jgi:8-oxo-dGTP pyrophosphatase MutT (NUDIX family)